MGNCLRSNRVIAQEEKHELPKEVEAMKNTRSTLPPSKSDPKKDIDGRKRKTVRFKLSEEAISKEEEESQKTVRLQVLEDANNKGDQADRKGTVVRIKVVLTQRELKQILSNDKNSKFSSVEQFLSAMKMRSRSFSHDRVSDENVDPSWKPALESIPEDH